MSGIENFIQNEKELMADVLKQAGVGSGIVAEEAAKILDLSAQILAAKLTGQDTAIAEAALVATRKNLEAASSLTVANLVREQTKSFLVRVASTVGKVILAAAI